MKSHSNWKGLSFLSSLPRAVQCTLMNPQPVLSLGLGKLQMLEAFALKASIVMTSNTLCYPSLFTSLAHLEGAALFERHSSCMQ